MSTWDTLADALNQGVLGALGRTVLYLPMPPGSGEVTVTGILSSPSIETETPEGPHLLLFLQLSDLAASPARGDTVTVDSTVYRVFQIEADQAGGVLLGLHRQG